MLGIFTYTDFQPNYFFDSRLDFYLEPKGARQRSLIRSSSTAENTKKNTRKPKQPMLLWIKFNN